MNLIAVFFNNETVKHFFSWYIFIIFEFQIQDIMYNLLGHLILECGKRKNVENQNSHANWEKVMYLTFFFNLKSTIRNSDLAFLWSLS